MAGIIAALVIGGASEGIDKIKSKRAERKARRQQLEGPSSSTDQPPSPQEDDDEKERGRSLAESKAREASEERRRASDGEDDELNTHPALRDAPVSVQTSAAPSHAPPPPYVAQKEPPSYEEHVSKEEGRSSCG